MMVLRELSAVMQMGNKVVTRTELSSLGWKLFLFMGSYREKGDMKMSEKKELKVVFEILQRIIITN